MYLTNAESQERLINEQRNELIKLEAQMAELVVKNHELQQFKDKKMYKLMEEQVKQQVQQQVQQTMIAQGMMSSDVVSHQTMPNMPIPQAINKQPDFVSPLQTQRKKPVLPPKIPIPNQQYPTSGKKNLVCSPVKKPTSEERRQLEEQRKLDLMRSQERFANIDVCPYTFNIYKVANFIY